MHWLFKSAFLLATSLGSIQAASASSAVLNVTAESLASAITLEEVQPLNFGRFAPSDGGVLNLDPSGTLTLESGDVIHSSGESPGQMLITKGLADQEVRVAFDQSEIQLESPDASPFAQSMTVSSFRIGDDGSGAVFNPTGSLVRLDSEGEAVFNIGARLTVNPNQLPGTYSGQVEVQLVFD